MHPNFANLLSDQTCEAAGRSALTLRDEPPSEDDIAYVNRQVANCKRGRPGEPIAFNENQLFLMVLIEMSRVIDSPYYQASASTANAREARTLYPRLVAQGQRYFSDHLATNNDDPANPRYTWKHVEGAAEDSHDDASHGSVSMRYISLLNRDLVRLTTAAAVSGESMSFDATYLRRFANTFLYMTGNGHLAEDNAGDTGDPLDARDGNCEGWIDLSVVDARVYDRCHEIALRQVNGTQPYIGKGSHSDLLANKRVRYPTTRLGPISSSRETTRAR